MSLLPQELLDTIVNKVYDMETLKNCSLAGSTLREPSQRILLRSLTLRQEPPNYAAVYNLLEESPHIAHYITRLWVGLPHCDPTAADVENLQNLRNVVGKLANVRCCTFDARRKAFLPALAPVLFYFLGRRSLLELHVDAIGAIPIPVLLEFIKAAPRLFFWIANIADGLDAISGPIPPLLSPLECLVFESVEEHGIRTPPFTVYPDLYKALAHPHFAPYLAGVRDLEFLVYEDTYDDLYIHSIISHAAPSLRKLNIISPS
ncbi:hypothetical protein B0H13DRAFT_2066707, partial [Mycena leptocephala]